jgi:hypothetical protein
MRYTVAVVVWQLFFEDFDSWRYRGHFEYIHAAAKTTSCKSIAFTAFHNLRTTLLASRCWALV